MSNTIVTNYSNVSGKSTNADKSLVIIVNKDGSVSLEKDTIKSLLESQYENATVSIVRMNDDGKPDDASDHSADESVPHINLTVDAFFDSTPNEKDSQNEYVSDLFGSEISLIGFQNDHCYTPLTSPSQSRRNSECDSTHFKDETGPYSPNIHKQYIPNSKKITVLENKIIAKGKNVQYYNSSGTPVLKSSDIIRRPGPQSTQLVKRVEIDKVNQMRAIDNDTAVLYKLHENFSDNDADQNLDSEYSNVDGTNKDGNLRSKSVLKKDIKKILSRKIELKNNGLLSTTSHIVEHDQNLSNRNRKTTKAYSAHKIVDERMKNSLLKTDISKGSDTVKQPLLLNTKLVENDTSRDLIKSDPKLDAQKNQKLVLRKDKKSSSNVTALLNDMTSLFSTPDVIRRVSTDSKPPKTPDRTMNSLLKKIDQPTLYSPNVTDKIVMDSSKITSPKADQRNYTNTTKVVTKSMSDISTRRHKNQKEGLDVMSPFDEVSLAQLLQETNSGMLSPDSMVLGPVTVQTPMLDKHDSHALNVNNSVLMSPSSLSSTGLNAPLSPSLDLLGGLHPEEEGLSEDLLRHVAQLVESSENLQEVIDKQVLGKVNISSKDNLLKQIQPHPLPKIEHNVSQQMMTEVEKPQINVHSIVKKEPIQIIRSNGRIITLPPIEAPATRSSKRKSMMNTSIEINPGVSSPDVSKLTPQSQTAVKQPVQTYSRSHRTSEQSKSAPQTQGDKKDDDAESDESWNSEDDPDRLWCICKQPHNNRFMICCDSCEDWFHGKCVNVTKAMGQEMEDRGIEWRCPNCVKKKGHANPSFKSLLLRKSTEGKVDERPSRLSTDGAGGQSDVNTSCIVCKKPARSNSIFCSNLCILQHAQDSVTITAPPASTNTKNARDSASNKPKTETRVIVYERKSGKILAGSSAPTTTNLKTWLQEHPTYEVVQPGTCTNKSTANISKTKPKPNLPKVQSVLTLGPDNVKMTFTSPGSKTVATANKASPKLATQFPATSNKSPISLNRPQTPKIPLKSPPTPKPPVPVQKKRDDSLTPQRYGNNTEPIRDNVKKTLREEISKRMSESTDVKFTQEEIHKFSVDTEYELHDLFKDVGAKYKAKYRSLMFNLKDRKNLTLWQKICDHSITPKQLVRLSPEELASQELAQWRDQEVKHQLELIKKSELDLLSCNKTYVLKTHKGEEVMESRTTATAELDPNVLVEDLVSVLNKSVDVDGNSGESDSLRTSPIVMFRDDRHSSHHKHSKHKSKSSKSSKSISKNDHSTTKRERSPSKHRSSKDSRSDSRSHHRRSSRDRDRKSSSSRRHSDSSRLSSHSKSGTKNEDEKKKSIDLPTIKDSDDKKDEFKMDLIGLDNIHSPVLDDCKIGDLNETANDLLSPNSNSPKSPTPLEFNTNLKLTGLLSTNAESDQEPSSTMDPLIWNGVINMVDVARFNVTAHEISGQSDDVVPEFESEFDVVGRISPATVWEYIRKMKKQGYNDILILRFASTSEEDKMQYMALYNYLSSRSRLGVIRVKNGGIKDFYILPLASNSSIPPILLPIQGPGFEELRPHLLLGIIVKQRRKRAAHLTLSAIPTKIAKLGHSNDRSYTPPTESSYTPPSSPKRKMSILSSSTVISGMPLPSFEPNLSPTVKDKIAASLASVDDDEPYSPGGSDSGSLERSRSPIIKQTLVPHATDLERQMEKVTREIEEKKKQIKNIAVTISGDSLDEPYSPSRPMSPSTSANSLPGLSSISLPSNLHEILASIHKIHGPTSDLTDSQSSTEAYVPQPMLHSPITSINSPYYKESFSGDVDMRMIKTPGFPTTIHTFTKTQMDVPHKGTSKLSTLSEAELLSMVPDDEILLPSQKTSLVYPPLPSLPPPPITDTSVPPPPFKRQIIDYGQPPPPGYEGC